MNAQDERERPPDLREQVGVAVGASVLVIEEQRAETALLRVAAMGGAARAIRSAEDLPRPRAPLPRDAIEAGLAPLLWRLKFGGDRTYETAADAVWLFGERIEASYGWKRMPDVCRLELLYRFAARVIVESLADRCAACGGTGLQELLRKGITRRTRCFGDPNVRHVQCRTCHGTKRSLPDINARIEVLGIPIAEYRDGLWEARFKQAGALLISISRRFTKPLRRQLERGI